MDKLYAYVPNDTSKAEIPVTLSESPRDWSLDFDFELNAYR
jgi:hypothetical protein